MTKPKRRTALMSALLAVFSVVTVPAAGAVPTPDISANFAPTGIGPANDTLDGALLIPEGYRAGLDNTGATIGAEPDGTCESSTADWSTWYYFQAPGTGNVWLQTRLTAPNAMNYITVFQMTAVGPPHTLGGEETCSAGLNVNNTTFGATSGTHYAVRISGAASDLGDTVTLEFETKGTLEGTVTETGTGSPLNGITVEVLSYPSGTELLASTSTIANGTWSVEAPTRTTIVRFSDPGTTYGLQYYDNVLATVDATSVVVTANTTTSSIDAVLSDAGTMSGTITNTGGPIEGAAISIYAAPTPGSPIRTAITAADGTYTLNGVAPGDYFVFFSHPDHESEWYDDVSHWNPSGTTITITAGITTVVDESLAQGGTISGTVTDDLGTPMEGLVVEVNSDASTVAYNDTTAADGTYEVRGITPGTYAVYADSDTVAAGAYGPEWWDDLPASTAYVSVDKVTVAAGSADVADFSLQRSMLSGTVTSSADALPVADVVVTLTDDLGTQRGQTTTSATGDYTFAAFTASNPPLSVSFEATSVYFTDAAPAAFAFDGGDVKIVDQILDPDNQAPTITDTTLTFNVDENLPAGTAIVDLSATDVNRADTVAWSITAGNTGSAFAIDSVTGEITTAASLDFETTASYTITVAASDGSLQSSVDVVVDVTDVLEAIPSAGFTDTGGSTFEADIDWLAFTGITKGCNPPDNTMFCPDAVVTRGQMAAFMVRALGLTTRLDDPFTDDDGSVFEADIEKLAAAGITKGCNPPDNTLFCPDAPVTREQMAAFLVRALGYTDNGGGDLFTDDDASIFAGDIDKLATAGVTKGCNPPENTMFCPSSYVTRGQMAAFLHRALES